MMNIGGGEFLVIALIALIVVGPEQLPSVLRKAGQYAAQARSMTSSMRSEFMSGIDELDPTKWDKDRGTGSADKPIVPHGFAEAERKADNTDKSYQKPNAAATDQGSQTAASDGHDFGPDSGIVIHDIGEPSAKTEKPVSGVMADATEVADTEVADTEVADTEVADTEVDSPEVDASKPDAGN